MASNIDSDINRMLARHAKIIVNAITEEVDPISIYLIGSFGRDEGAVFFNDDKILPLRDYDVLIVPSKRISTQTLGRIKKKIEKKIDLPIMHFLDSDSCPFEVWLTQHSVQDLRSLPILKMMDVKYSAKLLWGKDLRNFIEVEPQDISVYNVFLILSGFITGIIYDLDSRVLRENSFCWRKINLVYQCLKIYIEMSTVFLLLKGLYAPTFRERVNLFSEVYGSQFPLLSASRPDLPNRIKDAFEARKTLTEMLVEDKIDLQELLREVFEDIGLTFKYFIAEITGKDIRSKPLSNWLFKNAKWIMPLLVSDLFQNYLLRKRVRIPKLLSYLISRIYLLTSSFRVYQVAGRVGLPVKKNIILREGLLLELYAIALDLIEHVILLDYHNETMNKAAEKCSKIFDLKKLRTSPSANLDSPNELVRISKLLIKITDGIVHNKDISQQLGSLYESEMKQ